MDANFLAYSISLIARGAYFKLFVRKGRVKKLPKPCSRRAQGSGIQYARNSPPAHERADARHSTHAVFPPARAGVRASPLRVFVVKSYVLGQAGPANTV